MTEEKKPGDAPKIVGPDGEPAGEGKKIKLPMGAAAGPGPDPRFRGGQPVNVHPGQRHPGPGGPTQPPQVHPFDEFAYKQELVCIFMDTEREPLKLTGMTPDNKIIVESKNEMVIITQLTGKAPAHTTVKQYIYPPSTVKQIVMSSDRS